MKMPLTGVKNVVLVGDGSSLQELRDLPLAAYR